MRKPASARQDRCWAYIDSAARIASELGLGTDLQTPSSFAVKADISRVREQEEGEDKIQQRRSNERAWATAALMQRSLGTFTGLGSTVSIHIQWDQLDAWCADERAIVGDVQHGAYLNLRRIESYTRAQLRGLEHDRFFSLESIRVGFNTLFVEWQEKWVEHPRLQDDQTCKNYLLIVGLHIRLFVNVSILQLARQANREGKTTRAAYKVNEGLERVCSELAFEFCQFFLNNFEHRARHLGRNVILMVAWGVLVLLQLKYRKGRLLAARVSLLLAGFSHDDAHSLSFPRFYGRWLLSLINDLARQPPLGGHEYSGQNPHTSGSGGNSASASTKEDVTGSRTSAQQASMIPTNMHDEQQWNLDLATFLSQSTDEIGPRPFDDQWLGSYLGPDQFGASSFYTTHENPSVD